jgi:fluoride exporter
MPWLAPALVFLGGALGSLSRWAIGARFDSHFGSHFPWGTVFANVSGSFLIGFLAALPTSLFPGSFQLFWMVGFCGGYTTFSAFSLQTLNLLRSGALGAGLMNIALSLVLCLLFVWVGAGLSSALQRS